MFNWIKNFRKKERLSYPSDWAMITFSDTAIEKGVKDDRNKIIKRFFFNKFGNMKDKKYPYTEERVNSLQEIHKIPIIDRTQQEVRFPIFSKVTLNEARYIKHD